MVITRQTLEHIIKEELEKPILYELRIKENDQFLILIHGSKTIEECYRVSKQHILTRINAAYVNEPPWDKISWVIYSVFWNPKDKKIYRKIEASDLIQNWKNNE
jgi:hypothetical protein